MSDIGDTIKYLYDQFLLRDLLSFITPGAIVVISSLLLKYELYQILAFSKSIYFLVYIPIFGLFFIVGFAIQCFGEIFTKALDYILNEICDIKIKLFAFHHFENDREYWDHLSKILRNKDYKDKVKSLHERFVIFKQMCGNGALAITIAATLLAIKHLKPCWYPWPIIVLGALLVISLYVGHRVHIRRQREWEDTIR